MQDTTILTIAEQSWSDDQHVLITLVECLYKNTYSSLLSFLSPSSYHPVSLSHLNTPTPVKQLIRHEVYSSHPLGLCADLRLLSEHYGHWFGKLDQLSSKPRPNY